MATQNQSTTNPNPSIPPYPAGTTEADWAARAIEAIGRHKDNPEFLKRLFDDAAEARRKINEDYLRELDAQETK